MQYIWIYGLVNYLKSFNQNLFNRCKEQNEKFSKIFLSLSERNQNLEKKIEEILEKPNVTTNGKVNYQAFVQYWMDQ